MNPSTHHAVAGECRNCGAALAAIEPAPRYCTQCGQETALHPPSLREFVHEFVGHYVALEGALWKTLALLVLRPGQLTREYFAGRRRRYVLPLRLYLTASFLFFVVVKLLPGASVEAPTPQQRAETARVMAEAASAAHAAPASGRHLMLDLARCDEPSAQCSSVARAASRSLHAWQEHPQESAHQFGARLSSAAPYALFLMLPVFAAIVMLAYRNRHMLYGEHVVFGLHMHAFWFIALLASSLLPGSTDLPVMLLVFIYGVWAMRRVYGGRWGATLLRAVFVSGAYLTLLLVGTVLLSGGLWLIG